MALGVLLGVGVSSAGKVDRLGGLLGLSGLGGFAPAFVFGTRYTRVLLFLHCG